METLSYMTDEELIGNAYIRGELTDLERELLARFTRALDTITSLKKEADDDSRG